ncbi:putative heme-iron transport system permease protein IsdF [compost metagenome]
MSIAQNKRHSKKNPLLLTAVGVLLLALLSAVHLTQGEAELPIQTVIDALLFSHTGMEHQIIYSLRLPRTIMGILVGGALAVAGALLQNATRNPLASAATLGINAGAFFALTFCTIFAPVLAKQFPLLLTAWVVV